MNNYKINHKYVRIRKINLKNLLSLQHKSSLSLNYSFRMNFNQEFMKK